MAENPFDPSHLFAHVQDADYFEVPEFLAADGKIELPQPLMLEQPIIAQKGIIEPMDLRLTKFMVLEVAAAVLLTVIFVGVAKRASREGRPRGKLWNLFESMLVFIRDQVARPAIAHDPHHYHEADKFLPFLWTTVLLRSDVQPVGPVALGGLRHRRFGDHRRLGDHHVSHGDRRGHAPSWARSGSGWPGAAHGSAGPDGGGSQADGVS